MFRHPAWAVGSYSSGHQPGELPKSKSNQPRFATRWVTLYRAVCIERNRCAAGNDPVPRFGLGTSEDLRDAVLRLCRDADLSYLQDMSAASEENSQGTIHQSHQPKKKIDPTFAFSVNLKLQSILLIVPAVGQPKNWHNSQFGTISDIFVN